MFLPATNILFLSTTSINEGRTNAACDWREPSSMANKSNNTSQIISIPQGGGALHGIGETFAPDLHTGTGNFTVPIAMPPGRNGFQPQLILPFFIALAPSSSLDSPIND